MREGKIMTTSAATLSKPSWPWWLVLINGIAALIFGILLLVSPGQTTMLLIRILGFYWFVTGIMSLVFIFVDHSGWGWKLATGILGILAGFYILDHPLWSFFMVPAILIIVLAIQGIIMGVIQLVQAFRGDGWGIGILGIISIFFGLVLLASPMMAATALPFVLGLGGIAGGIVAIFMAFQRR
jgi:uncharacterized membrane protein HdeD (DUF308 family)